MTVAEFASFERILGQQVCLVNGIYWRRVRFAFYRPLLPFQELGSNDADHVPFPGFIGGFQHAVPSDEPANSLLNYLICENAEAYSLDGLDYNRKRQVKLAMKQFEIRPVNNAAEFKQKAYPIYLAFLERTQYQFGSRRKDRNYFCQWADQLFQMPRAVVLGGYRNGVLGGVSVSLLVEDTLCYTMFFCDTESLRLGLSDLMLHFVRQAVAESGCAKQVFAGLYKGGKGLDDFYLLRGFRLVRKPALLHLNPVAGLVLRTFLPEHFARLKGDIGGPANNDACDKHVAKGGTSIEKPKRAVTVKDAECTDLLNNPGGSRLQQILLAPH